MKHHWKMTLTVLAVSAALILSASAAPGGNEAEKQPGYELLTDDPAVSTPPGEQDAFGEMVEDVETTLRAAGVIFGTALTEKEGELEIYVQDGTGDTAEGKTALAALQDRWPGLLAVRTEALTNLPADDPSVPSGADEAGPFTSPQDLYDHWQRSGWPDTVGGAWAADGAMDRLVVAVVDGDQTAINAIRGQMADPDSLVFTDCQYTYNELLGALEAISRDMKNGAPGLLAVGIGNRRDDFSVDGQPCLNVTVSTLYAGAQAYAEELEERYGDLVEIELGDIQVSTTDSTTRPGMGLDMGGQADITAGQNMYLWFWLPLAMAGLTLLWLLRRRAALRTADGRTVSSGVHVGRAQAARAVRESELRPDRDNWKRIQEKLRR